MTDRHKAFVSFHHADHLYKDKFVRMMGDRIVDKSLQDGDLDGYSQKTANIRRMIRDDFIADATVTVVLVGKCTWKRKYVDWEIGASLKKTKKNPRCGLLGILLPDHSDCGKETYRPRLVHPRLADNCENGYALVRDWPDSLRDVQGWIHDAFTRRYKVDPDNSRHPFGDNWSGECLGGWQ